MNETAGPDAQAAKRLAMLREVDATLHDALRQAAEARRAGRGHALAEGPADASADAQADAGTLASLADLLAQVAAEGLDAARALALRLDDLPVAWADPTALRKWALHGLQRHRDDPAARLQHFTSLDPAEFADRLAEDDSARLIAARDGLGHYLAGFGFAGHRLDLHEPPGPRMPPQAPAIGEDLILFPRRCADVPAEDQALHYRAALAHAAAHLRHSPRGRPAGNRPPILLATMALIEDARVERLMALDYPGLHALWGRFHVATRETAGFDYAGLAARLARSLHEEDYIDPNVWVRKGRRMFDDAAARDLLDVATFDRLARSLAIDMEKMRLQPARLYRPQPAYRDDNALLWNLNAAAPEEETRTVVREHYERRDEDPPPDPRLVEVDTRQRTRYPEWDQRLDALREDWVTVIEPPRPRRRDTPARVASAPRQRLKGLARTPDRSVRLTRLAEGDELDLDAVVDHLVLQRAGHAPEGRIFRRHGRRRRATAIVLLLDLSASTERFVPGSFTTVLEVERRAATLVAQSLDASRDRIAVHGFSSNGRHEVHYRHLKDFDEPFGGEQQQRLAALEGALSTRMGAALRHASALLHGETADNKVILLLTDGEPSDVDVFEDEHLVADAQHAVATAAAQGVRCFCLTLDRHADAYVRRIFGARHYLIADRADAFAGHTGQTLVRLVAH